ncbi:alanine racemase [Synoicihabitans lomoniglobus]|uniref:Alanine racemase n=1 Tax=Synoicihabitans lomoniglobus TaxID=2909285 RepID=A0AAE9ZYR7_9BACT|nr:alanine racemase [Opitutaceae bacterium LMO-M01]WED63718.1 alanine racemase [Opitutaceae bacterium LMO-M01]
MHVDDLASPSILVLAPRLEHNLRAMQSACDAAGMELRPHIKTHKLLPIARRQLELGAKGLTCAKLSEAEAMLPSGVREIFLAHSLVDHRQAARIAALCDQLDELRVAVTSEAHAETLITLAAQVGRPLHAMMAIDSGLDREGVRDVASAQRIAARLARAPQVELAGFYTHEGQFYTKPNDQREAGIVRMLTDLRAIRDAIDPALPLWPGSSMTARAIADGHADGVQAVRPGAYVFGDMALSTSTDVMPFADVALEVLATVVDRPTADLALIDAGSKTFSSDRTAAGVSAVAADGRDLSVVRVNEEHGYLRGADVASLQLGERIRFVPAHVCTVVNLTSHVTLIDSDDYVSASWPVDARGCTQ